LKQHMNLPPLLDIFFLILPYEAHQFQTDKEI
jgi:hypothetical protein